MRTRNQANRLNPTATGEKQAKSKSKAPASSSSRAIDDNETLSNISRGGVGKLLKRVNKKKGLDTEDVGYLPQLESEDKPEIGSNGNEKVSVCEKVEKDSADPVSRAGDAINQESSKEEEKVGISQQSNPENDDDQDDFEWEDGTIPTLPTSNDYGEGLSNGVSVEFEVSPGPEKRKPVRRATAEEKEVAELVHKAHLLCLLGRGRLMDAACNDPLIQASLLSLLPSHILKIADAPNLTVARLSPLVSWIYKNFRVRSSSITDKPCHMMLKSTLETQEGTPEAVAALSVALFRALNLTCRFVSIMDVVSCKPDADNSESTPELVSKGGDIFNTSTLMVSGENCSLMNSSSEVKQQNIQTAARDVMKPKAGRSRTRSSRTQESVVSHKTNDKESVKAVCEPTSDVSGSCQNKSGGLKRKGDLEFQMQLEMAMSSTAVESSLNSVESPSSSTVTPFNKRMKKIRMEKSECSSSGVSVAIGSLRAGAPLHWAEVFCSGENLTGKWVHVDAVNSIIDGELKVEDAASAFKKSLRYVVAFAGSGAKDVTRRYCTKWHKVASQRINSIWWDAVLRPLKELESGATNCIDPRAMRNSSVSTRSSLEDMELETRALTEPLPTNQQAYKNHHLYVIERWIKKYEILYPKGPVLGFCSGHAVYPRTCVQAIHTRWRWLREGLQIKAGELPVKILKRSMKRSKEEAKEDDECAEGDHGNSTDLYGKWQTEPLCLPHAVNGIVPRNERGQVDVWSEKCLPPGTVHLCLPRVASIARRLEIDFAPAMVGFDFRNGKTVPVFEGIVVCSEFECAILEAYAEEEARREAEDKKRNEAQALARWYQLLSSIITRQRLNNSYGDASSSHAHVETSGSKDKVSKSVVTKTVEASPRCQETDMGKKQSDTSTFIPTESHVHEFVLDDREGGTVQLKRCRCGFAVEFEEL